MRMWIGMVSLSCCAAFAVVAAREAKTGPTTVAEAQRELMSCCRCPSPAMRGLRGDAQMILSRRALVAGLAASPLLGPAALAQGAPSLGANRLVLLGNKGGPAIRSYAPSPSANLLIWNNVPYVIDA